MSTVKQVYFHLGSRVQVRHEDRSCSCVKAARGAPAEIHRNAQNARVPAVDKPLQSLGEGRQAGPDSPSSPRSLRIVGLCFAHTAARAVNTMRQ